ncbi:MerR family transcriptional regulator [Phaeobacter gallaeciensis]|uniref:MerR family transcriptional regulator n=1 Tax=Phaeobacter gallaeciensis TaxID=60890 RepID=UPI00237F88D1|nr:MerR family transcriptional regulator [Phaeobacter gallaeciensis]MDE4096087.1 MerR family transcriptional regulator [Phaeobacter gallaeciensis]MDE4104898.1 MerR family transcriptional regulator [Phaeobacter gallaeciensis]MDE4109354.1 MerR family transcriptional regulator [Phaeobacter gallaeciensis]MDE4113822.1 MerR family transcriptional regulator [Phaeobacter gallaeciensis]MDE4118289.1 MerR family transcriptional regulator [Phaeobacter gallaeciensis]
MSKSPDAFRTISEVAEWLGVQAHVLRFWESKFTQVKPVKRAGGRRYYRPADMLLLGGIRKLLHDDGMSIKEVQAILRDLGITHVSEMSHSLDTASPGEPDGTGSGGGFAQSNAATESAAAHPRAGATPGPSVEGDPEIAGESAGAEEDSPRPASHLPFFEQEQFDPFAEVADESQAGAQPSASQAESIPETISELDQDESPLVQAEADDALSEAPNAEPDTSADQPIASDLSEELPPPQDDLSGEESLPFDEVQPVSTEPEPAQIMMDLGGHDAPAPECEADPVIEETAAPEAAAEPAPFTGEADSTTDDTDSEVQSAPNPDAEALVPTEDQAEPAFEVGFAPDETVPPTAPIDPAVPLTSHLDAPTPLGESEPAELGDAHADPMAEEAPTEVMATEQDEPDPASEQAPVEAILPEEPSEQLDEELAESDADTALQDAMDADAPREGFAPPGLPDDAEQDAATDAPEAGFPPTGDLPMEESKPRIISVPDENLAAQVSLRPGVLALLSQTTELRPEVRAEVAECAAELRQWLEAH